MRGMWRSSLYHMAQRLVELLSREQPRWEAPAMALLAELLAYPDMNAWDERVVQLAPRYLGSKSSVMRCLVLRALSTLCHKPAMDEMMQILQRRLMELLGDADEEVVVMTLNLLSNILHNCNTRVVNVMARELTWRLPPLFHHLFQHTMEALKKEESKLLKAQVHQNLVPLLCLLHEESQEVAEASRVTLLRAATFLKKRRLRQVLEKCKLWAVDECLLSQCSSSRAVQYVQQALWCLYSPQQPVREAAVRFLGIAGQHLRGQEKELQLIHRALQLVTDDVNLSVANLAVQTQLSLRAAEEAASSRPSLRERLCRAWRGWAASWARG
ncbi:maestro heat-like repeat family member 5 isoform X2 [Colius striatus]|uniref:maestro heat-like repeat family member 5 isoform X2 n=1 Tax=Colius striatus TaxID=57412 RepID=UPI002B1E64D1|nr:maestro heat-like repeat family member 5 isoform X2 [Colius striatus]